MGMQGRSQSMMLSQYQLAERSPWLNQMVQGQAATQRQIRVDARSQQEENAQALWESAKMWQDFLQPRRGWPHARLGDDALRKKLTKQALPSPTGMKAMAESA